MSVGAVSAVSRAVDAGLDWESIEALDDEQLEARLYGSHDASCAALCLIRRSCT